MVKNIILKFTKECFIEGMVKGIVSQVQEQIEIKKAKAKEELKRIDEENRRLREELDKICEELKQGEKV